MARKCTRMSSRGPTGQKRCVSYSGGKTRKKTKKGGKKRKSRSAMGQPTGMECTRYQTGPSGLKRCKKFRSPGAKGKPKGRKTKTGMVRIVGNLCRSADGSFVSCKKKVSKKTRKPRKTKKAPKKKTRKGVKGKRCTRTKKVYSPIYRIKVKRCAAYG